MRKLIMGIVDFRERMLPEYQERFRGLALAQAPDALFITCSEIIDRTLADRLVTRLAARAASR
jgi:carbonic anhydrase